MKKINSFRKYISLLVLSLLLVANTAACGEKPAAANDSSQDTPSGSSDAADDPSQSTPESSAADALPAPSTPNVPGVGDNSSLFAPGGTGAGNNDPTGADVAGMDNELSSYLAALDDLYNGSLDAFELENFSSVTEFYNSDVRVAMEDSVNQMLHELNDMIGVEIFRSASVSVQEPDRIIYTYQYGEILDNAAITASLESELDTIILTIQSSLKDYQSHGIPATVIQLNYLNADGTLVQTLDVTEDLDPAGITVNPDSALTEGTSGSLQDWLDSAEAAETVETINNLIASTGFTVSFAIDGNTLIYQYYLPAGLSFDDFTEEEREATFDAAVDANADSVHTLFTMFEKEQGLTLDAVRFVVYSAEGTELYSRDITP